MNLFAGLSVALATPFTYKPVAQVPLGACVVVPSSLPRKGIRQIERPKCRTNAGTLVKLAVTRNLTKHKASYYFRVTKAKNGAIFIRTYGHHVTLRVTWSYPAVGVYLPYVRTKKYHL